MFADRVLNLLLTKFKQLNLNNYTIKRERVLIFTYIATEKYSPFQ